MATEVSSLNPGRLCLRDHGVPPRSPVYSQGSQGPNIGVFPSPHNLRAALPEVVEHGGYEQRKSYEKHVIFMLRSVLDLFEPWLVSGTVITTKDQRSHEQSQRLSSCAHPSLCTLCEVQSGQRDSL